MGNAVATDAELIEASRRGDHAAFGTIVERYQRMVSAVAFSGTNDRSLGEDVAQDTFVTAWHELPRLRETDRLPGWLCGIARNLACAARRRTQRETPTDDVEVVAGGTPFEALSEHQTDALVSAALRDVPDRYREPLVLFYYEQQSVTDASRLLGISEGTMHQRLSRGRQYLADGVQTLVERTLARRRPRRDLAAAVLAVLALTARTSHVEAATNSMKGPSMLKMGIAIAMMSATAVGAGVAVKRSSERKQTATPPPVGVAARGASTTTVTPGRFVPTSPPTLGHLSNTIVAAGRLAPDCSETTRYLAELMFESTPGWSGMATEDQDAMLAPSLSSLGKRCADEHWSPELMACIVGQNDNFNAMMKCQQHMHEPTAPTPNADGDFVFRTVASVAPDTGNDRSCTAVGAHLAKLHQPDVSTLAQVPAEHREGLAAALAQGIAALPAEMTRACENGEWSEKTRLCMLAATNQRETNLCM